MQLEGARFKGWEMPVSQYSGPHIDLPQLIAVLSFKNLKDCIGCWMPNVRVGQQWDPIGLESQTSSNFITFIERAYTNDLAPARAVGIAFLDHFWKDRVTAEAGLFSTDQSDDVEQLDNIIPGKLVVHPQALLARGHEPRLTEFL